MRPLTRMPRSLPTSPRWQAGSAAPRTSRRARSSTPSPRTPAAKRSSATLAGPPFRLPLSMGAVPRTCPAA
eukprot:14350853-Alexandrium_andersonii.AAC.1